MPNRSWNADALVLSLSDFASDHKTAALLIPQEESRCILLDAAVFGGARSKLRGMVVPYQTGKVGLYSNPIKNTHKITDFTVTAYRSELREDLVRILCAAVCSELALKTYGTIDWYLVNVFLDGLCVSTADECKTALLRFLWRVIHGAGLAPVIDRCGQCGRLLFSSGTDNEPPAVYDSFEDACLCKVCAANMSNAVFTLSAESACYLIAVQDKPAGYSRVLPLSAYAYGELKRFLFFLTEKMAGTKLRSFQTGEGLL